MRQPVVAGQFYPHEKGALLQEIKKCFASPLGPGTQIQGENIAGAVVPHAGYTFSGPCAAHVFKCIQISKYKRFLILGFSHTGAGHALSYSKEDWLTPLGPAKCDLGLVEAFKTLAIHDEEAHEFEHSIEVQLPFLQAVKPNFSFLAVSVGDCHFETVGRRIAERLGKETEPVCILASSDFTHYGPRFNYVPFTGTSQLHDLDMGAVKYLKKLDSKGFLSYVRATRATICGKYPLALLVEVMKHLGVYKSELLKYYTSREISQSSDSVSYVSMIYKK